MARSQYVYLVWDREKREPIATFTVKHEMLSWLRNCGGPGSEIVIRPTWQVIRFRGPITQQVMVLE